MTYPSRLKLQREFEQHAATGARSLRLEPGPGVQEQLLSPAASACVAVTATGAKTLMLLCVILSLLPSLPRPQLYWQHAQTDTPSLVLTREDQHSD
jgi:hypothetical protein